jgi:hypothetical protein
MTTSANRFWMHERHCPVFSPLFVAPRFEFIGVFYATAPESNLSAACANESKPFCGGHIKTVS